MLSKLNAHNFSSKVIIMKQLYSPYASNLMPISLDNGWQLKGGKVVLAALRVSNKHVRLVITPLWDSRSPCHTHSAVHQCIVWLCMLIMNGEGGWVGGKSMAQKRNFDEWLSRAVLSNSI